jgi:hypothetical protein
MAYIKQSRPDSGLGYQVLSPHDFCSLSSLGSGIGLPRSKETAPPWDPTVGLCLGPYGGPRGAVSYERGAPVTQINICRMKARSHQG